MKTHFRGLDDHEVSTNRAKYGANILDESLDNKWYHTFYGILSEPMFLLLLSAALIYFVVGETNEAIIMILAIFFVSSISLYQENKSSNAVDSLRKIGNPKVRAIRDGIEKEISNEELVVGDIILLEDGKIVPADAKIIQSNDFSVNESLLTGESIPVFKSINIEEDQIKSGTIVVSGACICEVTQVGKDTEIGKIGESLSNIGHQKTPLQKQIANFTKTMVVFGVFAFILVCVLNYLSNGDWVKSLLKGLTLAMSVIPEEIPVAFSTFMALGAYHLYRKGVIAKSPYTVETLGAATVICTDKTGTLTENKMQIATIYDLENDQMFDYRKNAITYTEVLAYAMWSSEVTPFDPMEISIHQAYGEVAKDDLRDEFTMFKEYPLSGTPPIMTHIFYNKNIDTFVVAVKGSVEGVLKQCNLAESAQQKVLQNSNLMAEQGLRVLGVGRGTSKKPPFAKAQQEFLFEFLGLIGFYDPPKANIASVLNQFYDAGIKVKMVTGDFAATALAIAEQVGMQNASMAINGTEIMTMSQDELVKVVSKINVFARMFPEAKLKLIDALKANNEIVAMTGDGVNDAPALKSAHIGIAMGQNGSDVAKGAASLILMDDDLSWMVDAVALGRRIYENLKKAIMYIISIHIPIILIVVLPLVFAWSFTDIFSPVHVIFLELIMGPTCSIIFENEPIEANSMQKAPRKMTTNLFAFKELMMSLIQGMTITLACLGLGYYFIQIGARETTVRTIIFTTLIFSNILLTLVNRSMSYPFWITIRYRNRLIPMIILISIIFLMLSIYLPTLQNIFRFEALSAKDLFICFVTAMIGVMWVEINKIKPR